MSNHYDFLATPESHHHVSRLIVLFSLVVVIAVVGAIYQSVIWTAQVSPLSNLAPANVPGLSDVHLRQIRSLVDEINTPAAAVSATNRPTKTSATSMAVKEISSPATGMKIAGSPPDYAALEAEINQPAH